jgi:hypothetical protein
MIQAGLHISTPAIVATISGIDIRIIKSWKIATAIGRFSFVWKTWVQISPRVNSGSIVAAILIEIDSRLESETIRIGVSRKLCQKIALEDFVLPQDWGRVGRNYFSNS